jgi:hypothetical protein
MHFSHDKHQYYFEKYLRNEMKGEELQFFEVKLKTDEGLRNSFDFYLTNRKEIVAEELAEYDEPELMKRKPQKWGWLLAVFSALALVLIVDFYLVNFYEEHQAMERKPLIEKINVFRGLPRLDSDQNKLQKNKQGNTSLIVPEPTYGIEDSLDGNLIANSQEPVNEDGLLLEGDYFVLDSLFKVLENNQLNERIKQMRDGLDSLHVDSTIEEVVRRSFFENPHLITRQLLVEYWDSPIHVRGYLFNGKKLLLYGLDLNEATYLTYSLKNRSYYLIIDNQAYYLFPDGLFQKLALQ